MKKLQLFRFTAMFTVFVIAVGFFGLNVTDGNAISKLKTEKLKTLTFKNVRVKKALEKGGYYFTFTDSELNTIEVYGNNGSITNGISQEYYWDGVTYGIFTASGTYSFGYPTGITVTYSGEFPGYYSGPWASYSDEIIPL